MFYISFQYDLWPQRHAFFSQIHSISSAENERRRLGKNLVTMSSVHFKFNMWIGGREAQACKKWYLRKESKSIHQISYFLCPKSNAISKSVILKAYSGLLHYCLFCSNCNFPCLPSFLNFFTWKTAKIWIEGKGNDRPSNKHFVSSCEGIRETAKKQSAKILLLSAKKYERSRYIYFTTKFNTFELMYLSWQ